VTDDFDISRMSIADLISAVSSDSVAPGAGAAGAVALALAAACAGKAVSISLKHSPGDTALTQAGERLDALARRALAGADEDSSRFEEFIHEKDRETAERLIRNTERLQALADQLNEVLRGLQARIEPTMAGDLIAAQALTNAFAVIQRENLKENRRAAKNIDRA
jgi:formiminotetrahydrofolate cyclodeaminase